MTVETWNRDAPPGFQGLRDDIPMTFYYRHLPHWRQSAARRFVIERLPALGEARLGKTLGWKFEDD